MMLDTDLRMPVAYRQVGPQGRSGDKGRDMPLDDPTLGEVIRRLADIASSQGRLERKLDTVTQETHVISTDLTKIEARVSHVEDRHDNNDQWKRWALQLVLGAVVLAILSGILVTSTGSPL